MFSCRADPEDAAVVRPRLSADLPPKREVRVARVHRARYAGSHPDPLAPPPNTATPTHSCFPLCSLLPDTFNTRLHLVNSIHHYSLRDFMDLENGSLNVFVKGATSTLINHIFSCEVRWESERVGRSVGERPALTLGIGRSSGLDGFLRRFAKHAASSASSATATRSCTRSSCGQWCSAPPASPSSTENATWRRGVPSASASRRSVCGMCGEDGRGRDRRGGDRRGGRGTGMGMDEVNGVGRGGRAHPKLCVAVRATGPSRKQAANGEVFSFELQVRCIGTYHIL